MPVVPPPESLPTYAERIAPIRERIAVWGQIPRPFDVRYVDDPPWQSRLTGPQTEAHNKVWFRTDGVLPDDDLLHVCILAYLSDLTLLYSVLATHALSARVRPDPDGVARSRDVVPPAVPGRRVGALRHQFAQRVRCARAGHRALLRPGRADAGHRGAGGPGPAAVTGAVDDVSAVTRVLALKEWAAVVHALLDGRQTVLLRKGGIHEKRFSLRGSRFVVFPTVAHSHAESTRPEHAELLTLGLPDVSERFRDGPGGSRGGRGHRRAPARSDRRPGAVPHLDHGSVRRNRIDFRPRHELTAIVVRVRPLARPVDGCRCCPSTPGAEAGSIWLIPPRSIRNSVSWWIPCTTTGRCRTSPTRCGLLCGRGGLSP